VALHSPRPDERLLALAVGLIGGLLMGGVVGYTIGAGWWMQPLELAPGHRRFRSEQPTSFARDVLNQLSWSSDKAVPGWLP
jgi:hypothetical protein